MANKNEAKIDVTAEDKNTSAVFNKVGSGLQGLDAKAGLVTKSFGDIGMSIGRLGAVAGFGVVAAGLANLTAGAVDAADKVQDLIEITGGTANGLSAIANEAETAGVQLTDVSAALVKLERNLASQDEEGGKTAKALKAIGLSAKELKGLTPDQKLFQIAKALDGYADSGEKAAVVTKIYGKGAAALLPLLKDLAERSELVGTVTKAQAKAASDLKKDWNEARQSITLAGRAMASELIPYLSQSAQVIRESQKEYGAFLGFIAGIATSLAGAVGLADLDRITDPLKRLDAQINETFKNLSNARNELNTLPADSPALEAARQARIKVETKNVADLSAQLKGLIAERNKLSQIEADKRAPKAKLPDGTGGNEAADKAKASYDALVKSIGEKIAANKAELEAGRALNGAEQERAKLISDIEAGLVKLTPEREAHIRALLDEQVATEAGTDAQKEALKLLKEQDEALEKLRGTEAKRNADVEEAQAKRLGELKDPDAERRNKLQDDIDLLRISMEKGETSAEEYAKAIMHATGQDGKSNDISVWAKVGADGIESIGLAAIKSGGDLGAFGKEFADQLENLIIKTLILGPLLRSLGESLGGTSTGSANDNIWAQLGTSLIQSQSSGGRAVGGGVGSGRFYEVNERGPELYQQGGKTYLMTGGNDANIVPLQASANSGGAPQSVHVSIESKGSPKEVKSVTPHFDSSGAVISILIDDYNRGGKTRQLFGARA